MTSKTKYNSLKDYIKLHLNLNETNKNNELEIRFGTNKSTRLSKMNFDNIIRMIKSFDFISNNENGLSSLKISQDKSFTRAEVFGDFYIQEYCRNNSVEELIKMHPDNIKFMSKRNVELDDSFIPNLDNNDFKFRIAYNTETSLDYKDPNVIAFLSNLRSNKIFRFINRVTYSNPKFPLRIDCSITKFAKALNGISIEQCKLFNSQESYEVEIEIDNELCNNFDEDDLYKKTQQCIKYILYGIQESFYPISIQKINDVIDEYKNVIKTDKPVFCGPSSVTLQIENLDPELKDNVLKRYTVTDKADGIRKLLFINSEGSIYFIDQNLKVQYTGVSVKHEDIFNTIIDGEHILYDKEGNYINLYAAFDVYYVNIKSVRDLPLIKIDDSTTAGRLDVLTQLISKIRKHISNGAILNIITKTFDVVYDDTTIYEQCNKLYNRIESDVRYNYEIDGLIFTPADLAVGAINTTEKARPPNKNTWVKSFKWKPPEYNTIDFLVTYPNKIESFTHLNRDGMLRKYQIINLRVGFNIKRDGFINPFKNVIDGDFSNVEDSTASEYFPALFHPSNPYDNEAHICYIEMKDDANGIQQMFTNNKEIFNENMIVEFQYVKENDNFHRWIPLRVRYDKTYSLQTTGKNFGNDYRVANNNWHSIHYPVTKETLITGEIGTLNKETDIYYNNPNKSRRRSNLRNFHNFIKAQLINYSTINPNSLLFDIAVGKAGDLNKWHNNKNINFIFGLDLSRDNIENKIDGACKRYIDLKLKDDSLVPAIFISGDSSKNIRDGSAYTSTQNKAISNGIFGVGTNSVTLHGKVVNNNFGIAKNGFNVTSCQFALHYFFKDKNTLQNFIINIVESTSINGLFIGTCYNGKKIFDMLKQTSSKEFKDNDDNLILNINKKYDNDYFNDDISCLGYPIEIFQDSINKSTIEYLVNFEFFIRIMENYGFKLKKQVNDKILKNSIDTFESVYNIISTSPQYSYLVLEEYEKNISFLNYYFIFEKISNVNTNDIVWDNIDELDSTFNQYESVTPQKIKLKIKSSKK